MALRDRKELKSSSTSATRLEGGVIEPMPLDLGLLQEAYDHGLDDLAPADFTHPFPGFAL